jgi:hypothetical protein
MPFETTVIKCKPLGFQTIVDISFSEWTVCRFFQKLFIRPKPDALVICVTIEPLPGEIQDD